VVGEFAVGLADRTFSIHHTLGEPMPVASVTKLFVAVSVMRQVQAGRIKLDDPVQRYLPFLDRPWAARVTVRQLLRHRSGLPQPETVVRNFYARTDLKTDAVALAKELGECDLAFEPGSRFEYNNTDYVLLGAILTSTLEKSLEDVLREEIFTPAGMESSGVITGRRVIPLMPPSYDLDDGPSADARFPAHQELANYSGAGAAYSTARDLLAFNVALMGDDLLDRKFRDVMLESSPDSGFGAMGCWVYSIDFSGLGSVRIVERHGAIAGYNVVDLFAPEQGISVILLCNISSFAEPQTWMREGLAYRLLELSMAR
jgi:CubicO group peptidase (beta-lactamase class C family)